MNKKWIVSTVAAMSLIAMPTVAMAATSNSTQQQTSTPNAVAYSYPEHLIQYGSTGVYVKEIQQRLNQLPNSNAGQVDGFFGPKTIIAVKLFQMSHGLTADGVVGQQTWNTLFNR
jgi:peptidoglycan hydrolase-like protein with peptidoglycan-binding domain